jgi:3-hydroxypropanoate dehydrogenase
MTKDLGLDAELDSPLALSQDAADLLFRAARSVREFTDRPVSDATLTAAWDLAKWGPTAINGGPLRVLVVRSASARKRLTTHLEPGNKERVLAAPVSLVLAADQDFHHHLTVLAPHRTDRFDTLEAAPATRATVARTNALLQAGYLLLALRAVGLAVGPMGGMDAAGVDDDLLAGTSWRTLLVLNVGYVDGTGGAYPRAARLDWGRTSATA